MKRTKPIQAKPWPGHPCAGFTLVELMVALALLLIVLVLAFNFFFSGINFFRQGEERWLEQREIKKLGEFIESNIALSHKADIFQADTPTLEEGYHYIYQGEDNLIYFKNKDEATPAAITSQELELVFSREEEGGVKIPKALAYDIASLKPNGYSLGGLVFFPNMLISAQVNMEGGEATENSEDAGNVLRFVTEESLVSGMDASVIGCFIATAAFGHYDEKNVMLLRHFRDEALLGHPLGEKLVALYYRYSPPLAEKIAQSPFLRMTAAILLMPFIGAAVLYIYPFYSALLAAMILLGLYAYKKRLYREVDILRY